MVKKGFKDNEKVKPLCIMLPKISGYTTSFTKTKFMSSLMKDAELLEKYNKIWNKVSNSIRRGFDNEPVYNEKYLKTNKFL